MTATDYEVIRLVVAGDSRLMSDGLHALLAEHPGVKILGRVDDADEISEVVGELGPDALLISLRTRAPLAMAVIREARQLHEVHPDLGIVIVSDRGNGFAMELLRSGSARIAYLLDEQLTGIDGVVTALHEVLGGQTVLDASVVDALVRRRDAVSVDNLTMRELEVLEQIALGLSNRAVAAELRIAVKSVEHHVTAIFRKLGLTERQDAHHRVTAALTYLDSAHGCGSVDQ